MPERFEVALWLLAGLLIEKWLDYVERPRWLRRKARKKAKKGRAFVIIQRPRPKERHDQTGS